MSLRRGLYAILDFDALGSKDPERVGRAILRGGCACLQIRGKRASDRSILALARALRSVCREKQIPLVINDRLDLAILAEADGVHVGQDDLPVEDVRRVAPGLMIGLSTHTFAQVEEAEALSPDLIGFGPVFPTASKVHPDPVVGLAKLEKVLSISTRPVVAIGGITLAHVPQLCRLGVMHAAAISAVTGAADPELAAREFHQTLGGHA